MKIFQVVFMATLVSFIFTACGAGGRSGIRGRQCAENLKPVDMNVAADKKLTLETQAPEGEWIYAGADFYYVDSASNMRILVHDLRQANGNFKAVIGCVRGVKPGLANVAVNTLGISDLNVGPNSKISNFEAKRIGFMVKDTRISGFSSALSANEKPSSAEKVFEGSTTEKFLFMPNPDLLEIRSTGIIDNNQYEMVVRFNKKTNL